MNFLVEAIEFNSMVEANKISLGKELGSYVMLKSTVEHIISQMNTQGTICQYRQFA